MLLKRLIQNYYEVFGSFAGIMDTSIGTQIANEADNADCSVEEFCFHELGYENQKSKTIEQILASRDKQYRNKLKDLRKCEENQNIFNLCYEYYKNCQEGLVELNGNAYDIQKHRNLLRGKSYQKVRDIYKSAKLILGYKKINDSRAFVNNGLVCSSENLNADTFAKIEEQAFRLMLYGRYTQLCGLGKQIQFISLLSIRKPNLYLAALDIARITNTTFKELMLDYDVNIQYQMPVYDTFGCMIQFVNSSKALIVDETCTAEVPCVERML